MPRLVAALLGALLVLAGCAGADLSKQRFPRTTIPAGAENAGDPSGVPATTAASGQPADPAFAPDRLRLTDPCGLLDHEVLQRLGKPAQEETPSGFSRCSNFMEDKAGKDLAVTVEVGQTMTVELRNADKQIAGLRAAEQELDGSACFVSVITQDNPGLGITVQIGYKDGDACAPGRLVAESVVQRIKARAATRTAPKGSLLTLDPCALPERATAEAAVGAGFRYYPYGLHNCSWVAQDRDRELGVDFRQGFVPEDNKFDDAQTEVDLGGGLKGYQVQETGAFPSCSVKWVQRTSGRNQGELVEVKSAGPKKTEFDRCATAVGFAQALAAKIPRA
ncbi:DUF3558 family protein [Saccharothrix coeruleofusca]|uniref:DUF3558 family protein n=1 Tax=Saccharothrix coeruleofusca TaxID=33919 RepID=UPI00166F76BC|nr:DUF3558 family protein [Saccharothrix coeruleofusca]MBP2338740.1 hypothetical protein [Saccharothrix coeruleofusca]